MKHDGYTHVVHSFGPVFDENSRILILGSVPSVRSREMGFYYGHPQNRFWKVMSALLQEEIPDDIEGRRSAMLRHGIALYDTVYSCDIRGSSDSSIRNIVPTDISEILNGSSILHIFCNGQRAGSLYRKYHLTLTGAERTVLPSTSPANAAWSLDRLIEAWSAVTK